MKKILLLLLFLPFLTSSIFAEEDEWHLSFLAGVSHVFEYGLRDDYPIVPAHTSASFGAAISYFFTDNLGLELNGWYTARSKVTIWNAAGNDSIEYKTADHISLTINIFYHFFEEGKLIPYLTLGAGLNYILVDDETYVSQSNQTVVFKNYKKPDKMFNVGGGIKYYFKTSMGTILDVRYSYILVTKEVSMGSLVIRAGLFVVL